MDTKGEVLTSTGWSGKS